MAGAAAAANGGALVPTEGKKRRASGPSKAVRDKMDDLERQLAAAKTRATRLRGQVAEYADAGLERGTALGTGVLAHMVVEGAAGALMPHVPTQVAPQLRSLLAMALGELAPKVTDDPATQATIRHACYGMAGATIDIEALKTLATGWAGGAAPAPQPSTQLPTLGSRVAYTPPLPSAMRVTQPIQGRVINMRVADGVAFVDW